jgi:transcriptional regulator
MHIQSHFEQEDEHKLFELVSRFPLATFVVSSDAGIVANHFPMLVTSDRHTLQAHIPRGNEIWRQFDGAKEALAVFTGPDAYVSPGWYPSKKRHGKVVPTWNYAAVHIYGAPCVRHEDEWKLQHLNELTHRHEGGQALPWQVTDAPVEFTAMLLDQIVGIEMPIARLEGKWKISQNRSAEDQAGVIAGMAEDNGVKELMQRLLEKKD